MATPTWVSLGNANQYNQINTGAAVSNFTSATDVSPGTNVAGQAFQTAPAQLYPGQMWRFTANGTWSSTGSPGVSLGVYYGGAAGSPICYGSVGTASAQLNAASVPWVLEALGRVTTVGSGTTATWQVIGKLAGFNSFGLPTMMPQYTQAAAYDTSVAKLITLAATCSASAAANALTVYNWAVEYLTEP